MNRIIPLFIACILLCAAVGNAQEKKFSFGPKVGLMLGAPIPHGNNEALDSTGGTPLIGPNLGIFFLFRFNTKWSLWVEESFNRKGFEYRAKATDMYYVDEQCIDLPNGTRRCATVETVFNGTTWGKFDNWYYQSDLIIRYTLNPKWHLYTGPYYASLLSSKSLVYYDGFVGASTTKIVDERDLSPKMNQHDYGMNLGFHYQYKPIFVDFRLSYGFASIFRKDYKTVDYPVRNVFAQLSVAFQIRYNYERKPE